MYMIWSFYSVLSCEHIALTTGSDVYRLASESVLGMPDLDLAYKSL